jgi:hypothetical protein
MKPPRNLWPLGILTAFALFISGTVTLIVIACSNSSELVASDYYERELRHQSQMDRMERARQLASPARVHYDSHSRRITVALPPGHASAAVGKVELYRPSQAALDQHIDLRLDARGEQNIDATALRAGLWKVKVTWAIGGEEFSLDHRIVIGEKPT